MELNLGIPTVPNSRRISPDFSRLQLNPPYPTHVNQCFLSSQGTDTICDFLPWRVHLYAYGPISISNYAGSTNEDSLFLNVTIPAVLSSISDLVSIYDCGNYKMYLMKIVQSIGIT